MGMMGGKYKPCEYIEGFGNDYILTDIIPSSEISKIKYKIKINESGTTKFYFGGRNSQSSGTGIAFLQAGGKIRKDFGAMGVADEAVVSETIYEDEMTLIQRLHLLVIQYLRYFLRITAVL